MSGGIEINDLTQAVKLLSPDELALAQTVAADRAEEFFRRYLVHTKGEWAGRPLDLAEWQRDEIIRPLFGTLRPDGLRQYRTAYIEVPRKNGKSTISAGVALKLLCADLEPGAEIYSCAGDKDQARIVFEDAKTMVLKSPRLRRRCKVYRNSIVVEETGSSYKVISADAATKHGLNAHGVIFDELHTQPNRELWDVMTTSTGSRRQPLVLAITTAGFDKHSICWEQHEFAERILKAAIDDPTFFAVIYAAEQNDDWTDPKIWAKANPGLGTSPKLEYIATECARAQEVPGRQNTFRRLHLNQWTEQETRWLPMDKWDAAALPSFDDLVRECIGKECVGGLDLASVGDLTALNLTFRFDDRTIALPFFWVPFEGAEKRGKNDKVPYPLWIRQNKIRATEGDVTDYDVIRRDINELADWFKIKEIGYDPWNTTQIVGQLMGDGFTMVPVRQGFGTLSAPSKELENILIGGKLEHGGHEVLRWCAANVAAEGDAAGNLKPSRKKSSEKIDGIVALIIALSRLMLQPLSKPSKYETQGIVTVG